jgi:hypothetical protein
LGHCIGIYPAENRVLKTSYWKYSGIRGQQGIVSFCGRDYGDAFQGSRFEFTGAYEIQTQVAEVLLATG